MNHVNRFYYALESWYFIMYLKDSVNRFPLNWGITFYIELYIYIYIYCKGGVLVLSPKGRRIQAQRAQHN